MKLYNIENMYKIIYVAPERFESYEFIMAISNCDVANCYWQAHCVSNGDMTLDQATKE